MPHSDKLLHVLWEGVDVDGLPRTYGTGLLHEQEVVGRWERRSDGALHFFGGLDGERVRVEERATWTEEQRRREEVAWRRHVARCCDRYLRIKKYRLGRLKEQYYRACHWEEMQDRQRRRYIPKAVRAALMAEWEATGRVCGICGDMVAPGEQPVVDHVVPNARGGTSEPGNLRLTHRYCNGFKWASQEQGIGKEARRRRTVGHTQLGKL